MALNLKIIVSAGPCEADIARCLASIRAQRFGDWRAMVTIDPCGDRTLDRAVEVASGDPRIEIRSNPVRMFSMSNLIEGVRRSRAEADDVIVVLDGDDWFYDRAGCGRRTPRRPWISGTRSGCIQRCGRGRNGCGI